VTSLDFGRDYGVFSTTRREPRIGVAVDSGILDLADALGDEWAVPSLNPFMAQGPDVWRSVRDQVRDLVDRPLVDPTDATLHLPFVVGDFVDFYASEQHATNLGRMFRPDSEPLLPNWKHLPVGYHGRAGTVTVSGTPVRRPRGLRLPGPEFGPSRKLDVEVELGFVVGTPSALGTSIAVDRFEDVVFGAVVVNDWSARDLQAYEYVPLGPFLGKSFQTSISPWVVPLDALPRTQAPQQDPAPAGYLQGGRDWAIDVELELELNGEVLSRPPFAGDVLDRAPDAGAHDGERCVRAHGRPVRQRHRQRREPGPARLADRADVERRGAVDAAGRQLAQLPRGRRRGHDQRAPSPAGDRWARCPGRCCRRTVPRSGFSGRRSGAGPGVTGPAVP
jgi:2-keto-4-pentenoate hydratase/2-oxohepta-3-ene-1,7-dioic acid hydratase in catechol pathway